MTADQFDAVRNTLGLSHAKLAEMLGVGTRTPFRWSAGDIIPGPAARLLRLLALLRLTVPANKYEELLQSLAGMSNGEEQ